MLMRRRKHVAAPPRQTRTHVGQMKEILDQMKEIWINLELYIKSYEFSIFRDFFRIFKTVFLILFLILNNKNK